MTGHTSLPGEVERWAGEGWIDVSRPLHSGIPVWPGDRPFELEQRREPGFVLSSFATTCHVGTHVDAPLHFDETAVGVEGLSLARCVGPAEVVRTRRSRGALTPHDLPGGWTPSTTRVLIHSDSYPLDGKIEDGFAGLSADLVHWLADREVELLGIDTPSVDVYKSDGHPAHHALLARGLTWFEGLWFGETEPGTYLLIALPILLEGAEAAPVRAILGPVNSQF
jgi:arylformamidase